jgi:hypothetical protein
MTDPVSANIFASELLPRETLVWTGRPNPSIIFHADDWFLIPFSLMWGGFAVFWLVKASGLDGYLAGDPGATLRWFGLIWGTPFVLIGQYMIWGRFFYTYWVKQRTYYALTERRALVVRDGFAGRSCSSVYLESLAVIDKNTRMDDSGAISFGGLYEGEGRWWIRYARTPRPITFDDLSDVESLYPVIARLRATLRVPLPL